MPTKPKLAAIVLAAGYSSRMLEWKPFLPLGEKPVLTHVVETLRQASVEDIVVVAGHRAEEMMPRLTALGVCGVVNDRYDWGMYESVKTGVQALAADTTAFFLWPVDVPLVKAHSLRCISRRFLAGSCRIVYPTFQGERGHPPLISCELISSILQQDPAGGLHQVLADEEAGVREVAVVDEGILLDMDTAEDYRVIRDHWQKKDIPSNAECEAILARLQVPDDIQRHCRQVARTGCELTARLNREGMTLDMDLIGAAALLHDVARSRPFHAKVGGRFLRRLGYGCVAQVVECHMDYDFTAGAEPDEAAILYLADKLTSREHAVSLTERFASALTRYGEGHPAASGIRCRLETAQRIATAVERRIGCSLEEVLSVMEASRS
jgi:molybdenum cofactor cytidylyltransferase